MDIARIELYIFKDDTSLVCLEKMAMIRRENCRINSLGIDSVRMIELEEINVVSSAKEGFVFPYYIDRFPCLIIHRKDDVTYIDNEGMMKQVLADIVKTLENIK